MIYHDISTMITTTMIDITTQQFHDRNSRHTELRDFQAKKSVAPGNLESRYGTRPEPCQRRSGSIRSCGAPREMFVGVVISIP